MPERVPHGVLDGVLEPAHAPAIRLIGLSKVFGPRPVQALAAVRNGLGKQALREQLGHVLALHDVSLDMPAGQITVVMGLSGSGKSTLVRHINRLVEPTAGQVLVAGPGAQTGEAGVTGLTDVTALSPAGLRAFRRSQTAMVFQKFALLPHLTVLDNVQFGLLVRALPAAERLRAAQRWIARVGLAGHEGQYPRQLSGGMQQRVGLARALANDAPILLMDEPFSALDPLIRRDMQQMLFGLQQEMGKTIVFITHDLDEALRLGARIAVLRDGTLVQQGRGPELVMAPADAYIADFVKDVKRGQVLRCGDLLAPGSASAPAQAAMAGAVDGPTVAASACIDDAARLLAADHRDAAKVHDAHGRLLGVITLRDIVRASLPAEQGRPAAGQAQSSAA